MKVAAGWNHRFRGAGGEYYHANVFSGGVRKDQLTDYPDISHGMLDTILGKYIV